RLRQVQRNFGVPETSDSTTRLADAVDSMGLVEFVGVLAEDFGIAPEMIDEAVEWRYGTITEVASALQAAGFGLASEKHRDAGPANEGATTNLGASRIENTQGKRTKKVLGWLVSTAARLPDQIQTADEINDILGRPPGWLESHAGIRQRRVWKDQDPLAVA